MEKLPLPFACVLDSAGFDRQRERYRGVAAAVERTARDRTHLTVWLAAAVDQALVRELVDVESDCCPFFDIHWEPAERRLAFAVDEGDGDALDAVAHALSADG